jgi:hypothetical protein
MFRCTVEEFPDRKPRRVKKVAIGGPEDFKRLLERLVTSPSVSIEIHREPIRLIASLSDGNCALLVMAGDDDFYDLIGDRDAKGWATFTHGGQPADHPRRHFVSQEKLLEAVMAVVHEGKLSSEHEWERQGAFQTA